MLQTINQTPFDVAMMTMNDLDGVEAVVVVVKASFVLADAPRLAEEQVPVQFENIYRGEPGESSPRLISECHLPKPACDIVLEGCAHAPGGVAVPELDVGLRVGDLEKTIRVFGDRWFLNGRPTRPEPFVAMPIVYERAFGGTVIDGERSEYEPNNPIGQGFLGKKKRPNEEARLPNLEDPRVPYAKGKTVPVVGFGWIDAAWSPRKNYAGTYDEAWESKRMPYLPEDFDPRFFNAAHPDLIYQDSLVGGEAVTLINLSTNQPRISFHLPVCRFDVEAIVGRTAEAVPLTMDTLFLEPDEQRFCMTWRGLVRCPDSVRSVRQLTIDLTELRCT